MIKIIAIILCLYQLFNVNSCEKARFDFYRVYAITPETDQQMAVLKHMVQYSDSYKFFIQPHKLSEVTTVIVAPHKFAEFIDCLNNNNFEYKLLTNNLQADLDKQDQPSDTPEETVDFGWTEYYPLDNVYKWLKNISDTYPEHALLITAGKSYKGRELLGIRISHNMENPSILLDAGTHGSEWISVSVATYIINELLTSKDEMIRSAAENYNWYIFPTVNPDGYQYSMEQHIFWRKTVKPYGACLGADVNRNFDIEWNVAENNNFTCSDAYPGPAAFSEEESKSYSEFVTEHLNGTLKLYISFHAYAQRLLIPYAYTEKFPRNYETLMEIGKAATVSLGKLFKTQYTVGSVIRQIYPASGSSMDWIYDKLNVPLAFTYELRPQFGHGDFFKNFKLPAGQIIPTGKETLASIITIINEGKARKIY